MEFEEGHLLRIFVGELDKHDGRPLYEWILKQAHSQGISGATALRGMEGYGVHRRMHTAKVLYLSTDLPVVIEIVDEYERIHAFMEFLRPVVHDGMATLERVQIHRFTKP